MMIRPRYNPVLSHDKTSEEYITRKTDTDHIECESILVQQDTPDISLHFYMYMLLIMYSYLSLSMTVHVHHKTGQLCIHLTCTLWGEYLHKPCKGFGWQNPSNSKEKYLFLIGDTHHRQSATWVEPGHSRQEHIQLYPRTTHSGV